MPIILALAPISYARGQGQIAAGVGRVGLVSKTGAEISKLSNVIRKSPTSPKLVLLKGNSGVKYTPGPVNLIVTSTVVPQQSILLDNTNGKKSYSVTEPIVPSQSDFDANGCATLAAGAKCNITIVYKASSAKTAMSSATLNILLVDQSSNAQYPLPPIEINGSTNKLVLNAIDKSNNPFPDISFNPTAIFDSTIDDSSKTQTITIHNSSAKRYAISGASIGGRNGTDFKLTNCDAPDLDENNRDCALQVVYSPTSAGIGYATFTADVMDNTASPPSKVATINLPIEGQAFSTCDKTPGYAVMKAHWYFLPLDHRGIDQVAINCFYGTSQNLAFVTQVQYQYNPAGSANTVLADLVSLQFPGGVQLSVAGAAATSSCSSAGAGNTNAGATSTNCSGSAAGTTPSLTQDVQSIEQGGDLALKMFLPLVHYLPNPSFQFTSLISPHFGFTINGLSSQSTSATATDLNLNVSSENYVQVGSLPLKRGGTIPASIYFDYRAGWQQVAPSYVTTAGLPHQNFLLQQFSAGLVINNAFRISGERYKGPAQAYVDSTNTTVTINNFDSWRLNVQITP